MEILVSIFVLAVGLLGTSTLQLTSKRSNAEARERVTATTIAQELTERMRLNAGQLTVYTNSGAGRILDGDDMAVVTCTSDCTDEQMATSDLYRFEQAIIGANELISGNQVGGLSEPLACISGPNGVSGEYRIAIAWRGRTKLSDPTTDTCGQDSGLYDSLDGTEEDVYRRVLVLTTYIAEPT